MWHFSFYIDQDIVHVIVNRLSHGLRQWKPCALRPIISDDLVDTTKTFLSFEHNVRPAQRTLHPPNITTWLCDQRWTFYIKVLFFWEMLAWPDTRLFVGVCGCLYSSVIVFRLYVPCMVRGHFPTKTEVVVLVSQVLSCVSHSNQHEYLMTN